MLFQSSLDARIVLAPRLNNLRRFFKFALGSLKLVTISVGLLQVSCTCRCISRLNYEIVWRVSDIVDLSQERVSEISLTASNGKAHESRTEGTSG